MECVRRDDHVDLELSLSLCQDGLQRDVGLKSPISHETIDLMSTHGVVGHLVADQEEVALLVPLLKTVQFHVSSREEESVLIALFSRATTVAFEPHVLEGCVDTIV